MRYLIVFILALLAMAATAQVSVKRDSSNAVVIVSTLQQPDGTTVTVESSGVDSTTAKDRLFNTTLETYSAIGRMQDELLSLNRQATDLRQLYTQFDTTNFFTRTRSLYANTIYGTFSFREAGKSVEVNFRANAQGNPIAETGTRRGTIRIYAPNYIEVRQYFTTGTPAAPVDVFLCKKGQNWVGSINGTTLTLRPKR